ncbi:hypothetical protein D3C86_2138770 [compost metagenome]
MEGVPVELKVATIFCAIMALLPIPVTITRPLLSIIKSTTLTKSSFTFLIKPKIALASNCKVLTPASIIDFLLFKQN